MANLSSFILLACVLSFSMHSQGFFLHQREAEDGKNMMRNLCRRAEVICTRGENDDAFRSAKDVAKSTQYRRILSILKKLNDDVKRDKSRDGDNDGRSIESLAAK